MKDRATRHSAPMNGRRRPEPDTRSPFDSLLLVFVGLSMTVLLVAAGAILSVVCAFVGCLVLISEGHPVVDLAVYPIVGLAIGLLLCVALRASRRWLYQRPILIWIAACGIGYLWIVIAIESL